MARILRLRSRPLATWERDGLVAALRGAGLPTEEVQDPRPLFFRFETENDVPVGFGGLEVHGSDALMRSVVVLPPLRKRGFGRSIAMMIEDEARIRSCRTVWLLATDARDFFVRLGYAEAARDKAPKAIRGTRQFTSLCPDTAELMVKALL